MGRMSAIWSSGSSWSLAAWSGRELGAARARTLGDDEAVALGDGANVHEREDGLGLDELKAGDLACV